MRMLADENLPGPVIRGLREHGHDVLSVKEELRGADDRTVLRVAQEEGRLIVTFEVIAELSVPTDNRCSAMGSAFVSASFWMSIDVFM